MDVIIVGPQIVYNQLQLYIVQPVTIARTKKKCFEFVFEIFRQYRKKISWLITFLT